MPLTKLFFQLFSTTTNYTYFPSNTSSSQPTTCLSPLGKLDFAQYTGLYDDVIPRDPDICKIILAVILPPVGVFLERGCGADFFINILLTILGYIPGIIHALYIILKY
ncbi:hypothetical protein KAF25_007186 [Fusarium avenaceum]|uniref:Plasma membrane proteolipid 3 n=1 Tax=Fusarium avenaceum TaxID=40199 RepID=A0A9P7GZF4_9HYPO|nr:hypothetical protein KAF25_007186 [Fusarium avenaceum]